MTTAWSLADDGVVLTVRATPRGGRDAIEGLVSLADGRLALKARVCVAPEDGKANAALAKLLAKACGVPASSVELLAGASARLKTFKLTGEPLVIAARLAGLASG